MNIYIIAIKIHIGFIQFTSLLLAKDPESFTGIFQKTFQQNLTAGNKKRTFHLSGTDTDTLLGIAGYNIMFYKENFQNKTLLDRHIVSCRSSRQTIIGIAVPGNV